VFVCMSLQPDVVSYSMGLVNNFEVNLPADRQTIHDDRIEIVDPTRKAAEKASIEAMRTAIYGKKGK
jgi:hypothetical protein